MSSPASAAGAWSKPATPIASPSMQSQPPPIEEPGQAEALTSPNAIVGAYPPPPRRSSAGQRTPRTREASPIILPQSSLPIDGKGAAVPPASASATASSATASPAFAPAQFTPPASLRPFSLPPATRAGFGSPMFYSPPSSALRYSVSTALAANAQSSVVQRAAGSETTVFAPISGSRKMIDVGKGKGGGIIEDYNSAPVVAATAAAASSRSSARASPPSQPQSSPQAVLQPAVQSSVLSSPPASDAPVPAAVAPGARGGLSSFFGSIGSLLTGGLISPPAASSTTAASSSSGARPAASSASSSTLSKTSSIFSFLTLARAQPLPLPQSQSQPRRPQQALAQAQVQPQRPTPPARSATPPSAPISPTAAASASDSDSSSAPPLSLPLPAAGFSASGPCILDMPRGLIPLPARGSSAAAEIVALYDPELQPKGQQWVGLLNPIDGWRRSFAPSMYMKLLTASAAKDPAAAAAAAEPSPSPSAAPPSTAATPRKEEAAEPTPVTLSSSPSAEAETASSAATRRTGEEDAATTTKSSGTGAAVAAEATAAAAATDSSVTERATAVTDAASAAPASSSSDASAACSSPSVLDASCPSSVAAVPAPPESFDDSSSIPADLYVSSFDGVVEQCIRKDLARTFPAHRLFAHRHGLSVLFNVLRAYARFDPAVSYSQGMCFVVGVLMMHVGPPWELLLGQESETPQEASSSADSAHAAAESAAAGSDPSSSSASASAVVAAGGIGSGSVACPSEELLFWCLVSLMQGRKHHLAGLYTDDCEGLRLILRVLTQALAESDPLLSAHLEAQGIEVSLFATSWFVSVFSYRFDAAFTSAAWSHFLETGQWFLVALALQVLRHARAALMAKGFEALLPFLSTAMPPSLPPDLPDTAFADIDLSPALKQQLTPHVTMQGSYKKRR